MSIRHSRLIFPLLAFVSIGSVLPAQAETDLPEAAILKPEHSIIQQIIESKIESISLQAQQTKKQSLQTQQLMAQLQNNLTEPNSSQEILTATTLSNENNVSGPTAIVETSTQNPFAVPVSRKKLITRFNENTATKAEHLSSEAVSLPEASPGNNEIGSELKPANVSEHQAGTSHRGKLITRLKEKNVSVEPAVALNVQPEVQMTETSQPISQQSEAITQQTVAQSVTANAEVRPSIITVSELASQSSVTVGATSTDLQIQSEDQTPALVAQTGTTSPTTSELDDLKQQFRIDPLIETSPRTYPPSLTFGIPSGFGPGWGDFFISASGSTPGKLRGGQYDGSITTGFGLGDPVNLVGLSLSYNLGSIRNFGSNGSFDLSGSRVVYADPTTQVGVAAGWSTFAQYGNENGVVPSTVWGTVTSYTQLQPDDPVNKLPLLLSVGVGGGYYRQDPASTGVFGGVGLQVAPQLGMGLQWSGVGLNFGMSFVPVPTIPLTITAIGADLTDNSPGGTAFVLSVGYGFNFLPQPTFGF